MYTKPVIRRFFRIKLRHLLVLMSILSLLLGWMSYKVNRKLKAIDGLRRAGLHVYFVYDRPGGVKKVQPESVLSRSLKGMIDEDYFHTVVAVRGNSGNQATDAEMLHLLALPDLEEVSLFRTPITDEGLRSLAGCQKLTRLELGQIPITDRGLEILGQIDSLRTLKLTSTKMTGEGLRHLGRLVNLESLILKHNQWIRGDGLVHFEQLTELQYLELVDIPIDDAGLTHLEGLGELRWLKLDRTLVTDSGIASLEATLPKCRIEHKD